MRRLAVPLLLLALAAPAQAAVKAPKAKPTAAGFGGAAASVDPYATRAAIDVLRRGGNAVDAAVAAAAVLGVVEPYSSGIGGGGFMVIRNGRGNIDTIDGRETAPSAFTDTSFQENGQPIPFAEAVTSGLGVGVPGTPATWAVALRRHGTLQLRRLLKPAIRIAARGFTVDKTLQTQTEDNAERFADFPATANLYLPGGQPIQAGSVLKNPDLAETYRVLARRGTEKGFYHGPVATDTVKAVTAPQVREGAERTVRPGLMTSADLDAYTTIRRPAVRTRWRGYTLAGMRPPSSGGSTVLEAMNIMEAFGAPAATAAEELHRYLEASRFAFADRAAYLGDPAFVQVPLACLVSQAFANGRRALIAATAADSPVDPGNCGEPGVTGEGREGPNTTHLTVADKRGNVVTYTFTIEQTGGSGMVVPGRGFLLNNELTDFDFSPGKPNSPAAGKRPRSSMSPTLVLRQGDPVVALGSPGGSTIITTVLQILVNRFERGMTLPEAVADPRVSEQNSATNKSQAEPAFLSSPEAAALQALGHEFVEATTPEIGAATGIEFRARGRMQAVAEPVRRGGGSAMVVRRRR
jgi:gamma-glutamyltranspeptidase/glutathione hydrolase